MAVRTEFNFDMDNNLLITENTTIEGFEQETVNEYEMFVTEATAPYGLYLMKQFRQYELEHKAPIEIGDEIAVEFDEMQLIYVVLEPDDLESELIHFTMIPNPEDENFPNGTVRCYRCGYKKNPDMKDIKSPLTGRLICNPCLLEEEEVDDQVNLTPNLSVEEMIDQDQ